MAFVTANQQLQTREPVALIDITEAVKNFVRDQSLTNGLLNVMTRHTTATICLNESCEALATDVKEFLKHLVDPRREYKHNKIAGDGRPNAHSHILSYFMGGTQTIPVVNGQLTLGKWQRIFFVELDGPRKERQYVITFMGENGAKR